MLIPESYVARSAACASASIAAWRRWRTRAEIDGFAAELIDRFGPLPAEVENLLDVMAIKRLCRERRRRSRSMPGRRAPSSASARTSSPTRRASSPSCRSRAAASKLQPDHKLVFKADWDLPEERLKGVRALVAQLADIAGQGKKAA